MYMTKLFILLYADDIVVVSDSAEGLQNDIESLFIYFRDGNSKLMSWKLKELFSEKVASFHGICSLHLTGNVLK